jgi:transcription initiation factor TFIIIB Brf1 subunit/transcription initiation factor TFIIB
MSADEENCPECGSLDIIEDLLHKNRMICLDCNCSFSIKKINK